MKETDPEILMKDVEAILAKKNTRKAPTQFNEEVKSFMNLKEETYRLKKQELKSIIKDKALSIWLITALLVLVGAISYKLYKVPNELKSFFIKQNNWLVYLPKNYEAKSANEEVQKITVLFNAKNYEKVEAYKMDELNFVFENDYKQVMVLKIHSKLLQNKAVDCIKLFSELKDNTPIDSELKLYEAIVYLQLSNFRKAKELLKEIPLQDKSYPYSQEILSQIH